MLYSIIYVGREVLEMVFLTYLIAGALRITIPTILSALLGLISGIFGGYYLSAILEPYEWPFLTENMVFQEYLGCYLYIYIYIVTGISDKYQY